MTKEQKKKLSKATKKFMADPEKKAQWLKTQRTPKERARRSKRARDTWKNPKIRSKREGYGPKDLIKHRKIMKEIGQRPEVKAMRSRNAKKLHRNPKWIKEHAEAMKRAWRKNKKEWSKKISDSFWRHQNKVEKLLVGQGWDVIRRGWPDFICIRKGKVKIVEAKSSYFPLSSEQIFVQELLKKYGFNVETIVL